MLGEQMDGEALQQLAALQCPLDAYTTQEQQRTLCVASRWWPHSMLVRTL